MTEPQIRELNAKIIEVLEAAGKTPSQDPEFIDQAVEGLTPQQAAEAWFGHGGASG